MSRRYYENELAYLREVGREFAQAHPDVAHMLDATAADPSVERLLEGVAFLTARIHHKLDNELPEVSHSMLSLLWPHYLRPIPAMAIEQFSLSPGAANQTVQVPRGTEVESVPVDGTRCTFRTSYDIELPPLRITESRIEQVGGRSKLHIKLAVTAGAKLDQPPLSSLRLYLHGDGDLPVSLLQLLLQHCDGLKVRVQAEQDKDNKAISLPPQAIKAVGFAEDDSLLPGFATSFVGYRLLQEYFVLPQKFHFVDVTGLQAVSTVEQARSLELEFDLQRPLQSSARVTDETIKLGCTPVVNLFDHNVDPFILDHKRVEYRLRPAGRDMRHYEVFSIDQVEGIRRGSAQRRRYQPFVQQIAAGLTSSGSAWYELRVRPSNVDDGTESWMAFAIPEDLDEDATETISIDATCTNRGLPAQLRVGEIRLPTAKTPSFVRMESLTKPTLSVPPPRGSSLLWRLIGHLTFSRSSLRTIEDLRSLLTLYNFRALVDEPARRVHEQRMQSLVGLSTKPADWLVQGRPIRGISARLQIDERKFGSEGDVFVFGLVMERFLALWATMNAFSRLTIELTERRKDLQWAPRLGDRRLV